MPVLPLFLKVLENVLGGGMLADYIFEPFMKKMSSGKNIITFLVGKQSGSGIGLIFVLAGLTGIAVLTILKGNPAIKQLDQNEAH